MNRDQKAAAIEEIAARIKDAEAVLAVDYRGISVPQAAELRSRLRGPADTRFAIVKNTLTERAADQAGAESLKELLEGPTAFAFVHGDVAAAAKALSDYARETDLLPFKGGLLNGDPLDADQIRAIARLPARDVLYGQLVGTVASPLTGLARTLNALVGGLAIALGQVRDRGLVGGEAPEPEAEAPAEPEAEAPADQDAEPASTPEEPQPDQAEGEDEPAETGGE